MSADHPEDTNHGDTVAAWTSVTVIMIGFAGLVLFFYLGNENLTWASIGVIGVGAILGPILAAFGLGKKKN
jgi:Na+/proline symporter